MQKITIATPFKYGGSYLWGKGLAKSLTMGGYEAHHVYDIKSLLRSYFSHDVLHAALPILGRRVILTVHGDYRKEENVWRHFWKPAIRKADIVTVPSHYLKRLLDIDSVVISNGIFANDFKKKEHVQKERIIALTVTNLNFKKKAEGVLKIMDMIEDLNLEYWVCGGGRYLPLLGDRKARILGWSNDVPDLLQKADLFLYYSGEDSFGMTVLEAMASGLPIVTNEYGAACELIENKKTGYIAQEEEFASLVEKLSHDVKLREKVGSAARAACEEEFSWQHIAPLFIKMYEELV